MKTKITRLLLTAVLMMCCMVASAVGTQPSVGNGLTGNPYQIATLDNLLWFANHVNSGNGTANAILTADITMNTGVLNSNGDLNSGTFEPWTSIGGYGVDYSGEFNGNGHTISGLYLNDGNVNNIGLFGKTGDGAYIHELGVKDSYFYGKDHVGGICGDFAYGKIENCWNGATVIGKNDNSGGIAGSCWIYASVAGCYNIGKISVESNDGKTSCGGICGMVSKNVNDIASVSNCVSLYGKCDVAYNLFDDAEIDYVLTRDASAFKSGEVCWRLNGAQRSTTWRQHLGKDSFPIFTGDLLIYFDDDNRDYLNESMCDKTDNHLHTFESRTMSQGGSTINYWHCTACGNDYQFYDRVNELQITSSTEPSAGDGSQDNPYQIATLGNLLWFADYVNSGNASVCAILTADITMNASVLNSYGRSTGENFFAWSPIGGHGVDYSGEFNGNGHTISGLYFKNTNTNNVGLFGKANNGAYIHDLGIKDSYFYGSNHVGGICGDFANGKIENCWNGATVMAHDYNAGGISGSCWIHASIANCYNIGDISTYEEKGGKVQDSRFGGICGSVYSSNATYTIDNCYTLKSNGESEKDAADGPKLPYASCNKIYGLLIDNCPPSKIHDSYVKDAAAFVGGEVCYRLNRGVTDGTQKWYQTLGSDLSPVFDNSQKTVLFNYDDETYTNSSVIYRKQRDATIDAVGFAQECWRDILSGKIYADKDCQTELNTASIITYQKLPLNPVQPAADFTMHETATYNDCRFDWAAETAYEYRYTAGTRSVEFIVRGADIGNARIKWFKNTGDIRYGEFTIKAYVNNQQVYTRSDDGTMGDVMAIPLPDLKQDDVVRFEVRKVYTAAWDGPVIIAACIEYTRTKEGVTLKADDKRKIKGVEDPELTWHIVGGTGDYQPTGITLTRDKGEEPGTYAIHVSQPEGASPDIDITFVDGTFTIVDGAYHEKVAPTTTTRGFTRNYWEDASTGKCYEDPYLEKELNPACVTYLKLPLNPVQSAAGFTMKETATYNDCQFDWAAETTYEDVIGTRSVEFIVRDADIGNARIKWFKDTENIKYGEFTIKAYVNNQEVYTRSDDGTMGGVMAIPLPGLNQDDVVRFEVRKPDYSSKEGTVTIAACMEYTMAKTAVTLKADDKMKIKGGADPELTWQVVGDIGDYQPAGITLTREKGEEPGTYAIHVSQSEGANPDFDITFVDGTLTIIDGIGHEGVEPTISTRGKLAYWEDASTGKYYEDPYLEKELNSIGIITYLKLPLNPVKSVAGFTMKETATYNNCRFDWAAETTYEHNVTGTCSVEFIVRGADIGNARIKWFKNTGDIGYGNFTIKAYVNNQEVYTRSDDGTMGDVTEIPLPDLKQDDVVRFEVLKPNSSSSAGPVTIAACIEYTRTKEGVSLKADDKMKIKGGADPELTWRVVGDIGDYQPTGITLTRDEGEEPGTYAIHVSQPEGASPDINITLEDGTLTIVDGAYHEEVAPTISTRGFTRNCWEDASTGKCYEDPYLEKELNPARIITYIKLPLDPVRSVAGFTLKETASYYDCQFDWAAETTYEYDVTDTRSVEFIVRGADIGNARIKWFKNTGNIGYGEFTIKAYVNTQEVYTRSDDGTMGDVMAIPLPGLKQDDVVRFEVQKPKSSFWSGKVTIAACIEYTRTKEDCRTINIKTDDKRKIKGCEDPELTWQVVDYVGDYQPTGITLTRDKGEEPGAYAIHVSQPEGANPGFDITFVDGTLTIVDGAYHEEVAPTISTRGFTRNCWEDASTGKCYEDPYLEKELSPACVTYIKLPLNPVQPAADFTLKETASYYSCQFDWAAETTYEYASAIGTRSVEFIVRGKDIGNARIKWFKNTGDIGYGNFTIKAYVNNQEVYTRSDDGTMGDVMAIPLPGLKQDDVVRFEVQKPKSSSWGGKVTIAACIEYTRTKEGVSLKADDKMKIKGGADPELTWQVVGDTGDYQPTGITLTRDEGEKPGAYAIHVSQPEGASPDIDITFVDGTLTIVDGAYHEEVESTISTCGSLAYWEDATTGKYYEDPYLEKELNPVSIITYLKLPLNPVKSVADFTMHETATYNDCRFDWAAETAYEYRYTTGTRSVEFIVRGKDIGNARIKWFKNTGDIGYGNFTIKAYVNTQEVYTRSDDGTMGDVMAIPLSGLKQDDVVRFEVRKPNYSSLAGEVTIAACIEYTRTKEDSITINIKADDKMKIKGGEDPELTWQVVGGTGDYQPTGITLTREKGEEPGTYAIHVSQPEGANPGFDITFEDGTLTIVDGAYHEKLAPTITTRGFIQNYWEDASTGKYYEDPYLEKELNPIGIITYLKLPLNPVLSVAGFTTKGTASYNDCQFDWAAETTYEYNVTGTRSVEYIVRGKDIGNARIKWFKNTGDIGYGNFTIKAYVNNQEVYTRSDDGTMGDVMEIPLPALKQDDVVRFEVLKPKSSSSAGPVTIAACIEYTRTRDCVTLKADDKMKIKGVADPELTWQVVGDAGDYQPTGITLTRDKGEEPGAYAIHVSQPEGANPDFDITFVDGTLTIVDGAYHEEVAPTISTRGFTQNCWEDATTGKCYEDPYLEKELNPARIITYLKLPLNPVHSVVDFTLNDTASYYDCHFDWAAETTYEDNVIGTRSVEFIVRGADIGNARIKWFKNTGNIKYGEFTIKVYVNTQEVYTRSDDGTMGDVMSIPLSGLKQDDVVKFEVRKPYTASWAGKAIIAACLEYTRTAEAGENFLITAHQDPMKKEHYYATFYSSEYACKVPEGVTAYTGSVDGSVLRLTAISDDIIPAGEAVVLRLTTTDNTEAQKQIALTVTKKIATKSDTNILLGTDEEKTLGANDYALSLGQNGVGFYDWFGRTIDAHKAYLTLPSAQLAPGRSLGMKFDDGTVTGIPATIIDQPQDDVIYNLQGQKVDESYKGLIIKNGKKIYNY